MTGSAERADGPGTVELLTLGAHTPGIQPVFSMAKGATLFIDDNSLSSPPPSLSISGSDAALLANGGNLVAISGGLVSGGTSITVGPAEPVVENEGGGSMSFEWLAGLFVAIGLLERRRAG